MLVDEKAKHEFDVKQSAGSLALTSAMIGLALSAALLFALQRQQQEEEPSGVQAIQRNKRTTSDSDFRPW